MSGPTPTPGRTDAAAARLRADARAVVRRRTCAAPPEIASELAATWEVHPPTADEVAAALADDPAVHGLPDGRFIHLLGAVEGRLFTTRADTSAGAPVVLPVEPDLAVALLPYRSWARMPVRRGCLRGMAERVRSPAGADVLVLHPSLLPHADPLVAVMPGPEGVRLVGVAADDLATATLRRALVGPGADGVGGWGLASWSAVDRLLLALVGDPWLCRAPAERIGRLLRSDAPRSDGRAA